MPDIPVLLQQVIIAGLFSLAGVGLTLLVTWRLGGRQIRSAESLAIRDMLRKTDADLRAEQRAMRLELQRCEENRVADANQHAADEARHQADERQRRSDAEQHQRDEDRHKEDMGEIARNRTQLARVQTRLDAFLEHVRRGVSDATDVISTTQAEEEKQ